MQLSRGLILLASCGLGFFGAASAATGKADKFQRFYSSSPIDLDDSTYNDMTSKPRDYYAAVILTAMDARYGCQLCRDLQPEWNLLAKSWSKATPDTRLLFGTLDFDRGKMAFQQLKLHSAPVLLVFPPTVGRHAKPDGPPSQYEFTSPMIAEHLYKTISRHLHDAPALRISHPINYARIIGITTLLLGSISIFTVALPYLLPLLQSRNLWAALSLIAVLLFTSGHMFNHIRKAPYVAGDGKGGITYFAGGFSNQFGLESQIIAAMFRDFGADEFKNNVVALVDVAKFFKVPSILTTSFDTGPNGPMVKEIRDALPDAPLIRRPGQINAMDNEEFVNAVKKTGKKQVVISGVLTEVCATFPALSLREQGYEVFVVTDCSGTFSEHTREAAHKRLVQHGVQLMNWAAISSELHRDWRNDIQGFGKLWLDHVPGYWCLMQSYQTAKSEK
ncbi:oligosaccharyl transferase subunit ost3/OST6 [Ophidiomyces ophidiicola]|uniref:Oligosaccharyl transferase subunit ost3/OST6 n=1 Tax=Ophidiomyces ophidiicola TaxID=1387563 RepID=A0ACB8UV36_9EURO|nr:oligosaccharyl transferase subunit ost3/OST6 [Ophidiomyces ophidiicola]KAI2005120.1 oligosaccharyl transferase subunit ost3/OST6 [Ophidiomyces ophidiicola]KAI2022805.1 oligosaccharyl transferase subunit ost3/OST6 [Ophidiomyces ophidiicola]KAI2038182.1 oligosaccharyl transferase subunit ost3/OST6 [Ophidiomyces ophidiicola]KAI2049814.1 oligosaccharyl transferase subunit ost3/OST6 [Ophidiomyces ophidiicola]